MTFTRIRYEKAGNVARVTLDRPEVLNAMDLRMHEELSRVWDDVEADSQVRVVLLSGAGDRAFSVGQDLKEQAARIAAGHASNSSFGSRGRPGWPRLTERLEMLTPVVAKVRGYALGGGFELALASDVIVASTDATFALPEVTLGLTAGAGGLFRLARQLPTKVAMGHLLTGRPMSACRAYDLGLVNEVVPGDELDACAEGWLADIVRAAPLAVQAVKQVAARSETLSLSQAFAATYPAEERRRNSHDSAEGVLAFAEGRQPRWQGR